MAGPVGQGAQGAGHQVGEHRPGGPGAAVRTGTLTAGIFEQEGEVFRQGAGGVQDVEHERGQQGGQGDARLGASARRHRRQALRAEEFIEGGQEAVGGLGTSSRRAACTFPLSGALGGPNVWQVCGNTAPHCTALQSIAHTGRSRNDVPARWSRRYRGVIVTFGSCLSPGLITWRRFIREHFGRLPGRFSWPATHSEKAGCPRETGGVALGRNLADRVNRSLLNPACGT